MDYTYVEDIMDVINVYMKQIDKAEIIEVLTEVINKINKEYLCK